MVSDRIYYIFGDAFERNLNSKRTFSTLFGLKHASEQADIEFNGKKIKLLTPNAIINQGWAFIPANRRDEGLTLEWPILKNISLVIIHRLIGKIRLILHNKRD